MNRQSYRIEQRIAHLHLTQKAADLVREVAKASYVQACAVLDEIEQAVQKPE